MFEYEIDYNDLSHVTRSYIMSRLAKKEVVEFLYNADGKDWFKIGGYTGWAYEDKPIFGVIY